MSKFKIIHVIPQWYLVSGRVLQSSAAAADIWVSLIYIFVPRRFVEGDYRNGFRPLLRPSVCLVSRW